MKKGVAINHLSVADAAYIAGFLDGEGSIMIANGNGSNYRKAHLRVALYNNDLEVLKWIVEKVGAGALYKRSVSKRIERIAIGRQWKQGYAIQWNGGTAHQVIRAVRRFLHIKVPQADLAIQYHDHLIGFPSFRADIPARVEYYWKMRELNRKGPALVIYKTLTRPLGKQPE